MKKAMLYFLLLLLMPLYLGAHTINIRGNAFSDIRGVSIVWFQDTSAEAAGDEAACATAAPSNQPQDIKDIQVVNYTQLESRFFIHSGNRDLGLETILGRLVNVSLSSDDAPNPNPLNAFLASKANVQELLNQAGFVLNDNLFLCLPALRPESEKAAQALQKLSHTYALSDLIKGLDAAIECENDRLKMYKLLCETEERLLKLTTLNCTKYNEKNCPLLTTAKFFSLSNSQNMLPQCMQNLRKKLLFCVQNLQNVKQWDCFKDPIPLQEDVIKGLVQAQNKKWASPFAYPKKTSKNRSLMLIRPDGQRWFGRIVRTPTESDALGATEAQRELAAAAEAQEKFRREMAAKAATVQEKILRESGAAAAAAAAASIVTQLRAMQPTSGKTEEERAG